MIDLAVFALLIGWVVATWRRNVRYRDGWLIAFTLLLITTIRSVVDPDPTALGRSLDTALMGIWFFVVLRWWRRSGVRCLIVGHTWLTMATGKTGTLRVATDNPHTERRLLAGFDLAGFDLDADAILTRVCADCGTAAPREVLP